MRILMIVTVAALLGLASGARAQSPTIGPPRAPAYGPGYRPPLSPYLNLLRDGAGTGNNFAGAAAANYFLGTIPEFQRRANVADVNSRIGELDERTRPDGPIMTGTTPIPNSTRRYFNNTGGYYPSVQLPRR